MDYLDNFTPEDLMIISAILAIELTKDKTDREIEVIASIALSVANLMFISANVYRKNYGSADAENQNDIFSSDSSQFNINTHMRKRR
ncbi:MAG: hypothetical protein RR539_04680 [Clostridium sp.]|uniref:hypothetical protein n=1 Tax=Clostridium sp. TaxID=1506 RepID=UPI002FCBF823